MEFVVVSLAFQFWSSVNLVRECYFSISFTISAVLGKYFYKLSDNMIRMGLCGD